MTRILTAGLLLALTTFSTDALAAETYTVDEVHSAVIFKAHHFGAGYTWGRFNGIEGSVEADGATLTGLTVIVKTDTVDTNSAMRDKHLRSPDFLNSKEFQTITFTSTEVTAKGEGVYAVSGTLAFNGQEKPMTVDVTYTGEGDDPWGNHRYGVETSFTIKRSEWGMSYGVEDGSVGDEIELHISVEGQRKK